MSEEGEVMLSDVAREVTPQTVTPAVGKGALGHGDSGMAPSQDTVPDKDGKCSFCWYSS